MKKSLILLFLLGFIINANYALLIGVPMGGTATALGGIVLDKDLSGYNGVFNPSMIAMSLDGDYLYNFGASYANDPYGFEGLDNALIGVTWAKKLDMMNIGAGISSQMDLAAIGLNQYRFYFSGSAYYTGLSEMLDALSFVDGIAAGLNLKLLYFNTSADFTGVTGFHNPVGIDMDLDITIKFFDDKLNLGFLVSDLLDTQLSFFNNEPLTNVTFRGVFLHGRFNLVENFSIFCALNLAGSDHYVDRGNIFGSSTFLANTYFGFEASFLDSLYVRVGMNEGRLTGGFGLIIEDLMVNVGVLPLKNVNLYYQVDVGYRFGDLGRSKNQDEEDEIDLLIDEIDTESVVDEVVEEDEELEFEEIILNENIDSESIDEEIIMDDAAVESEQDFMETEMEQDDVEISETEDNADEESDDGSDSDAEQVTESEEE